MICEIISVGTELLLGSIVNTNAAYIAERLSVMGISLYRQTVVGDNESRIKLALKSAFETADLVIMTGGLGPTQDDITKEVASDFFNQKPVEHAPSLDKLKWYFKDSKISSFNYKQALFPKEAVVLDNENGTAPGAILIKDSKRIVLLPGPPSEMRPMFEKVCSYLSGFQNRVFLSRELKFFGIGESALVEILDDMIKSQTNPTIAPYASDSEVKLRITASADSGEAAKKLIDPVELSIRKMVGEFIYGIDSDTLESVAIEKLIGRGLTLSTAESCTGGVLASLIVDYPGASKTFLEGFVTYSNEEKMKRLNVNKTDIDLYGAVSAQVAEQMAKGVVQITGSDVGISITGIAGPSGGTTEKPIGTVFVSVCLKGKSKTKEFHFSGNRHKIRIRSSKAALKMLIDFLEK